MQPKRLIISVLVVILMLGAAVMSISAAPSPFKLSVQINSDAAVAKDPVVLQPGDDFQVTLNVDSTPGVFYFSFYLEFNPEALEFATDEDGNISYAWSDDYAEASELTVKQLADNKYKCTVYDTTITKDNKKTGEVITFNFKVKELFHGTTNVSITMSKGDAVIDATTDYLPEISITKAPEIQSHTIVGEPTYKDADCENPGTVTFHCSTCDKDITITTARAKGHVEVTDKGYDATCSATGKTDGKHCSVCNKVTVEQQEIAKLAHTPGAEATCTTAQTCEVCNEEIVAAKGHTVVVDGAKKPTMFSKGLTEGEHCSVCNEVLKGQDVIASMLWLFILIVVVVLAAGGAAAFFIIKKKKN